VWVLNGLEGRFVEIREELCDEFGRCNAGGGGIS